MDDGEKQFINNFLESVENSIDPKLSMATWLFINAMYIQVGREKPAMIREIFPGATVEP